MTMLETNDQSLGDFINKTHSLLSTLAVFAALTGFAGTLEIKWLSNALTFVLLIGMTLIWHEIQSHLPNKLTIKSKKLYLFRYVLLLGFSGFVLYILLEFRTVWHFSLFIPLTAIIAYMIHASTKAVLETLGLVKVRLLKTEPKWWNKVSVAFHALRGVYIFLLISFSFGLAMQLHSPTNILLDAIRIQFQ